METKKLILLSILSISLIYFLIKTKEAKAKEITAEKIISVPKKIPKIPIKKAGIIAKEVCSRGSFYKDFYFRK